jgi:transcriptional regulator with XRE-family HTH domain
VAWREGQAEAFGHLIRTRRKEAGLTQHALADLVGISANHVQLIESGRQSSRADGPPSNPQIATVYAFADALGVKPSELLPDPGSSRES